MEKRLMLFLSGLFLCVGMAIAQTQVKGTIISADDGEPLPGANVKVQGEKMGTTTNLDGEFTITVPNADARLVISHMGMITRTVKARNGMRIALDTDNRLMDEVMVVAFGQQTKSSFTGSAVVVGADELSKKITSNAKDALVGSVPGLQIHGSSGTPGSDSGQMTIRGLSSMYAGVEPLVIVDGSPYSASLLNIPTEDIESITVLKDASSAALYGARGAAGVILVTTKKGTATSPQVNVDVKWGANTRALQQYETIQDPNQFVETYYRQLYNYAASNGMTAAAANQWANNRMFSGNQGLKYNPYTVPDGQNLIGVNGKLNPNATLGRAYDANGETYYILPDDFVDEAFKTGFRQEYNVNVSGGSDRNSYYASAGYLNENGVVSKANFERFTARLKADYRVRDWLKIGANVGYVHSKTTSNPNLGNLLSFASQIAPIYPLYVRVLDENGNPIIRTDQFGHKQYDYGVASTNFPGLSRPYSQTYNPISQNMYDDVYSWGNQFNGSFTADVDITKWLRFNSTNNLNYGTSAGSDYTNPFYGAQAANNGQIIKSQGQTFRQNYIQTLTFYKEIKKHDINFMVGHEWYKISSRSLSAGARGGFSPEIQEINAFSDRYDSSSSSSAYNVEGYFGNLLYNYDQKYFVNASYRRDGTSRFMIKPTNYAWGNFWSVGAGWLINKEKFFTADWVDQLKLKFSIGQQGNDNIGNWGYTNLYSLSKGENTMNPSFAQVGNEEITWETTTSYNLGLEWSLFKGRLTGGIDFYNKKVTDLLFWLSIPESYGSHGYWGNLGDIRNRGVELTLSGDIIRTHDIVWNLAANLAHNKTKILKLPEDKIANYGGFSQSDGGLSLGGQNMLSFWYEEGKELYNSMIPEYAGVNENGEALYWVDKNFENADSKSAQPGVNHDYTTTDFNKATYYEQGSIMPKVSGGFSTTLKLYNVDISANFDYQLGGKIYDFGYAYLMNPITSNATGQTYHKDILNSWTAENTGSDIPRFQYADLYVGGGTRSSRFLTKASYLNFQSFTVGYTFPKALTQKIKINKIRIYAQGQNLCFWSARRGLDPRYSFVDTPSGGSSVMSPLRTIMGGVQVSF
ncbi:MAG: SusC/RagA family TonB-linked outer membrane protein [Bacteroidaceae bacterium]|nr:SusC/RagA family TonB-linked outer membrane protein [Bacteroidaceae bacterium]